MLLVGLVALGRGQPHLPEATFGYKKRVSNHGLLLTLLTT